MAILAIDTATDRMGVALVDEGGVRAAYEILADRPHAVELPQAVTRVLAGGGATLEQLDAIAIDIGPGSFTGLRIGLAFVKAIAFVSRRPVIGIASLDVMAAGLPFAEQTLCPMLDAKRLKVYAAAYRHQQGNLARQSELTLATIDEALALVQAPAIFLGDGAQLYRDRIIEQLGARAVFAPAEFNLPSAATLGRLAVSRARAGQFDDIRTLVPEYLYGMACTIRPSDRAPGSPRKVANRPSEHG